MRFSTQYWVWEDKFIERVSRFCKNQKMDNTLYSDIWLLAAVVINTMQDYDTIEKNKREYENPKIKDAQKLENEVFPFLAYLYDKPLDDVRNSTMMYNSDMPIKKIVFRGKNSGKNLELDGHLADVVINSIREDFSKIIKVWEPLINAKPQRQRPRQGLSVSAKFIFRSMQYLKILDADTCINANAIHHRFIYSFLNTIVMNMKKKYPNSFEEEVIKELLRVDYQ